MHLEVKRGDNSRHVILFDEEDAVEVLRHNWHVTPRGPQFYAATNIRGSDGRRRLLYMHNLVSGIKGPDHVNRNGLDNRRCNLRPATRSQQGANRTARAFKGVGANGARFVARCRQRHLGTFDTPEEAALAYNAEAIRLWGEFAKLNEVIL